MPSILNSKKIVKIGIDGGDFVPFSQVKSGIQRLVDSFLKEISQKKPNNFLFNYYYFGKKTESQIERIRFKKLPRRLFSSLFLPFYFKKDGNQIFLGFSGFLPPLINSPKVKKIIFLYDLGFLKYPKLYTYPQKLINNTLNVIKNADKIIVLSKYAKRELINRIYSLEEEKIIHLYPGTDHFKKNIDQISINRIIEKKLKNYFLFVGVIKPIKNIERLLRIFSRFLKVSKKDDDLILIGEKEKGYFNKLLKSREYQKIKERIKFLGNVSESELVNYYLNATAVVNFSRDEGFCFPVFEALSLGKKVVVNNLPIYYEFEDKFENLLIGKNEKEIINLMIKASKAKDKLILSQSLLKWSEFNEKLLVIIKKI